MVSVEVAESDFTSLLAEAEADESSAVEAYEKLTQENAVTKATKNGAVKAKSSEVKQLEVALGNYKENKVQINADTAKAISEWNKPNPTNAGKAAGEIMRLINGQVKVDANEMAAFLQ